MNLENLYKELKNSGFTDEEIQKYSKEISYFPETPTQESVQKEDKKLQEDIQIKEGEGFIDTRGILKDEVISQEDKDRLYKTLISTPQIFDTITPSELENWGVPKDVIEKLKENPGTGAEEGLKSSLLDPLLFQLENAVATKVLKAPIKEWFDWRNIPRSTRFKIEAAIRDKNYDLLKEQIKTLQVARREGFTDPVLSDETKKVGIPDNVFGQQDFIETFYPQLERKTTNLFEKVAPGSKNINDKILAEAEKLAKKRAEEVKKAYDKVSEASSENLYDVRDLRNRVVEKMRAEGVPEKAIKRAEKILWYTERNLSPREKLAVKKVKEIEKELDELYLKKELKTKEGKSTRRLESKIKDLETKKTNYEKFVPEVDFLTEKQLINKVSRLNEILFQSTYDMSKKDKNALRGINLAKNLILEHTESMLKSHNPKLLELWKEAKGKALQQFKEFGSDLGSITKNPQPGEFINKEEIINSMVETPEKIRQIIPYLEKASPGIKKEVAEEWVRRSLGEVAKEKDGLIPSQNYDLHDLQRRLNNLISNRRKIKFIEETLGTEKVQELKATLNIVNGMTSITNKLGKGGPLEKGLAGYILKGDGFFNRAGRTAKLAKDAIEYYILRTGRYYENPSLPSRLIDKNLEPDHTVFDSMKVLQDYVKAGTDPFDSLVRQLMITKDALYYHILRGGFFPKGYDLINKLEKNIHSLSLEPDRRFLYYPKVRDTARERAISQFEDSSWKEIEELILKGSKDAK